MTSVYGYIRFSYFGKNDTKIARQIVDQDLRFEALYNAQRMEERFYFFENITLPSIRDQVNQDFKILVVSSEVMPDEYKTRLNAAVRDIPQIEVIYSDAPHVTYAINPWMSDTLVNEKQKTVHFRLDDDDAISCEMIDLLSERINHARRNEMLTYPRGFYLASSEGKPYLLRKFEPYIAIAWAFVNRPGQIRNPYQGVHGAHFQSAPSMMDPRPYAYIHVAHESSDTRSRQAGKLRRAIEFDTTYDTESGRSRIEALIQKNFPSFTTEKLKDIITHAPSQGAIPEDGSGQNSAAE